MMRASACSRCGACKIWNDRYVIVKAYNPAGAKLHDRVRVSLEPGVFLKAIGILYGIPFAAIMLGFFAGTYLGRFLNFGEYAALIGFSTGIASAFLSLGAIKALVRERHRIIVVEIVKIS